jgi:hypothetical protein
MEFNLYEECIKSFQTTCAYSYATLGFGIIILILNIFAFIKMTIFYHKMNFENTLLLFSSIQSLVLIFQMVINSKLSILCVFIALQILLMFLINYKFHKISLGHIDLISNQINHMIFILNILYFIGYCIIYFIFHNNSNFSEFYINVFYYILEICTSIFLAYHCCKFSRWINKNKSNDVGNVLFYSIKKKQFSFLPITNIIFSSLEFIIDIAVFLSDKFTDLKIKSNIYINYIILFIFFLHNSVIFITFYWLVRVQYSSKIKTIDKNTSHKDIVKIIDNDFIHDYASSGNENLEQFIYDEKNNNKLNNTFDSFEIINYDEEKKEKDNNNRRDSRASNFDDEDLISEKNNNNKKK